MLFVNVMWHPWLGSQFSLWAGAACPFSVFSTALWWLYVRGTHVPCIARPSQSIGAPHVIMICGFLSLAGFIVTFFFVEDRRGKAMASSGSSAYGSVAGSINTANDRTGLLSVS